MNKPMHTLQWLIKREFWEHKGSLFWTPIVIGAAMIALVVATTIWGLASGNMKRGDLMIDGQRIDVADLASRLTPTQLHSMADALASSYLLIGVPLLLALGFVLFFYCAGALNDERRDRSILFWKSLPLSDEATVLSKAATALVVAPLITIGVATATSLVILLLGALFVTINGVNLFGLLLLNPGLYLTPLQLLALLPIYALWALPTVGWVLMVSSWARSKVFLWAVGVPLIVAVILKWSSMLGGPLSVEWYMENIVVRLLGSLYPTWLADDQAIPVRLLIRAGNSTVDMGSVVAQSYMTLARPDIWIGAIAGAAMLYAAVRLRRWRDES